MGSEVGAMRDDEKDTYYRSSEVRYGANCPGILEMTFFNRQHYLALTGSIVNLSSTGCLFANEKTPWGKMVGNNSGPSIFNIIDAKCHIYIPWTTTHCAARIRRLGSYIVGIEFKDALSESLVKEIASMEPERGRRFRPKSPGKYNRIIPIAHM